ncbi:MAG: hypothetical protein R6V35_05685 [Candidatus Nanohaloarchaea archaeon]
MEEISGLKELYENFEQLSGLDVEDYEIAEVDEAGDYPTEKIYEVNMEMGEKNLPESESFRVGLTYFENSIGDNLRVSFKNIDEASENLSSNKRNLMTVPFRQFFDQEYDLDLTDYSHRPDENREFTVRKKSDGWERNIPWALRKAGMEEFKEASDGIAVYKDGQRYVLDLRDAVQFSRLEQVMVNDPERGLVEKNERKDGRKAENLSELQQILEGER